MPGSDKRAHGACSALHEAVESQNRQRLKVSVAGAADAILMQLRPLSVPCCGFQATRLAQFQGCFPAEGMLQAHSDLNTDSSG